MLSQLHCKVQAVLPSTQTVLAELYFNVERETARSTLPYNFLEITSVRFGQVDSPGLRSQDEGRWLPRPAWLKRLHRFLQVWVWGLHLNCSGNGLTDSAGIQRRWRLLRRVGTDAACNREANARLHLRPCRVRLEQCETVIVTFCCRRSRLRRLTFWLGRHWHAQQVHWRVCPLPVRARDPVAGPTWR